KEARTQLAPLSVYKREDRSLTLLDVEIFTGRKHQIRRHLSLREHPVLGDMVYGNPELNRWARGNGLKRLFLQSHDLRFPHPITGETVRFSLPLNNELQAFVQACQTIEPPTL
ncbi:MAG TPA: RNA pseudouridine synthase, partial [Thermotogota bacterium]|nr:RNA pseudouridine synthase [Thermotogota bacterium]